MIVRTICTYSQLLDTSTNYQICRLSTTSCHLNEKYSMKGRSALIIMNIFKFVNFSIEMQIRVSSVISNSPIVMNVDCDMYSNNSETIRDALCFFLDEEMGHKIGFVQYPQNFNNLTKNNIYGNSHQVTNQVRGVNL